jgi:HAD superfamily hydrolase (TIGR01509 family)
MTSANAAMRARPPASGPVLFDCDGLLLDTETCWSRAESALFARYGRPFGVGEKQALLGSSMAASGLILERLLDQPQRGEALNAELLTLVHGELARGAEPLPGAVAIVAALQGRRPIAVVSNTPRELLLLTISLAGFADAFDLVIAGDEVANPKPAPDLYLRACATFPADPADAIALEDSPTGLGSARAAGVYVIGVPSMASLVLDADLLAPSLEHPDVWATLRAQPPLGEA